MDSEISKSQNQELSNQGSSNDNQMALLDFAFKFMHEFNWSSKAKVEKSKLLIQSFVLTEDTVKKISGKVIERIKSLSPEIVEEGIRFSGKVGYSDHTHLTYLKLDDLLNKAGDQKDPILLELNWYSIVPGKFNTSVEISLIFNINRAMTTDWSFESDDRMANASIAVSGESNDWVEHTFNQIEPYVQSIKLGGMYKPLFWFKNEIFVTILTQVIAFMSIMLYSYFYEQYNRQEKDIHRKDIVKDIKSAGSINEKFDLYIADLYEPVKSSGFSGILLYFLGIAVSYVGSFFLAKFLLPKLVPRSSISIGLAKNRFEQYENTFKLVIFTILLSGILIPLIRKVIGL